MSRASQLGWRPLLDGESRARAINVARQIACALAQPTVGTRQYAHEIALLHAYLAETTSDDDAWRHAAAFVEQASQHVADETLPPALHGGIGGVGWVFVHLCENSADDDVVDELIASLLRSDQSHCHFDLMTGLAGLGVYALERPPHTRDRLLGPIVRRLDEAAEHDSAGTRWLTPAAALLPERRAASPHGHYDLGVAHGVAGVIGFLAAARLRDVEQPLIDRLLEGSVRWLLDRQLEGTSSRFPFCVAPDGAAVPARAAWCYGDPGIALCLLGAADAMQREDWRRAAIDIAVAAAHRDEVDSGVVDGGLCHGAAGLAHIFNRLFHETGREELRTAGRSWSDRLLDFQVRAGGIAGYRAWRAIGGGEARWIDDPGLLTGASGVALALLASASAVEPSWDRMLLMSAHRV